MILVLLFWGGGGGGSQLCFFLGGGREHHMVDLWLLASFLSYVRVWFNAIPNPPQIVSAPHAMSKVYLFQQCCDPRRNFAQI